MRGARRSAAHGVPGEGAERAAAGTGGEAQTVERLAPRLAESRREHDADGGADHAAEDSPASLPHAATIAARRYLVEHQGAVGEPDLDRVARGEPSRASSSRESGFSIRRWMARFSGRAPNSAS